MVFVAAELNFTFILKQTAGFSSDIADSLSRLHNNRSRSKSAPQMSRRRVRRRFSSTLRNVRRKSSSRPRRDKTYYKITWHVPSKKLMQGRPLPKTFLAFLARSFNNGISHFIAKVYAAAVSVRHSENNPLSLTDAPCIFWPRKNTNGYDTPDHDKRLPITVLYCPFLREEFPILAALVGETFAVALLRPAFFALSRVSDFTDSPRIIRVPDIYPGQYYSYCQYSLVYD